jgi:hypothetical protein
MKTSHSIYMTNFQWKRKRISPLKFPSFLWSGTNITSIPKRPHVTRHKVLTALMLIQVFWNIMPSIGKWLLMFWSIILPPSFMVKKALHSSEPLANIYHSTRHDNPYAMNVRLHSSQTVAKQPQSFMSTSAFSERVA